MRDGLKKKNLAFERGSFWSVRLFFQKDIECVGDPADAEQEDPQDKRDPKIRRDLVALVQVDSQRGNENCYDNM
jgi:hypothetical protein